MPSDDMPGPSLGLSRIVSLLRHLDSPHLVTPVVHVAGTNGKGSICAYIDSIFRQAGYRTGRFNSPHLVEPRDSVLLEGRPVSAAAFAEAVDLVDRTDMQYNTQGSPFERLTATAFHLFATARPTLDLAVVEVGLGGELDATNVCPEPLVSVLAPVDLDHQALLGNTVEEIAEVKCGIFKHGRPCIVAPQKHVAVIEVAMRRAREVNAPCYVAQGGTWRNGRVELPFAAASTSSDALPLPPIDPLLIKLPLAGSYQAVNAATAILTAHVVASTYPSLAIGRMEAYRQGLERTTWPGRLSWVNLPSTSSRPALHFLADGAHNPSAAVVLRAYLDSYPSLPTTLIVALSHPREPSTILEPLLRDWQGPLRVIATGFSTPVEGMPWVTPVDGERIAATVREMGIEVEVTTSLEGTLSFLREDELNVVAGSLYLVADLYRLHQVHS